VEHSTGNTVTNIVTATNVTALGQVWGLGLADEGKHPTAITLYSFASVGGINLVALGLALLVGVLGAALVTHWRKR
jgi:hypothetical protein